MTRTQLADHKKNIVMLVALIDYMHRGIIPTDRELEREVSIRTIRYRSCTDYIRVKKRHLPTSTFPVLENMIQEIRSLHSTGKCLRN